MGKNFKRALSLLIAVIMVFCTVAVGGEGFADLLNVFSVSASAVSLSDLSYSVNSDEGTVTITGCNTSASGELVVPGAIEGKAVTVIGAEAFKNCTGITKITLPEDIEIIEYNAFFRLLRSYGNIHVLFY